MQAPAAHADGKSVFFAANEERLVVVDVIEALMADAESAVAAPVPVPEPEPVPVPAPAAELPGPRMPAEDTENILVDTTSLLRELHGLSREAVATPGTEG